MTAGDRFKKWIDDTAKGWAGRLGSWCASFISGGFKKFGEDREPEMIDLVRDYLTAIRDNPNATPEMKAMIDKTLSEGKIFDVVFGWFWTLIGMLPQALSRGQALGNLFGYNEEMMWRSHRLDPISVITAWWRYGDQALPLFEDLKEQGWSDSRIEWLKGIARFMPSAQDLVNWQAREVFEPEMIARYGLDDEFDKLDLTLFGKIGVTEEQARNYWRAHWEHASWIQVVEMLRRGQLKEEDVWEWFRVVEIPPYWRQKLINISWEVPTRVDVRRFWDMRTIDEKRLREIYTAQGYHGKDLDDYVLWTKVYVAFPDLMTRYKNGWLTIEGVREELISLGMPADRVEEMIQTKVKATDSEKMAKQRDLTMSQIVKGVKKDVITRDEGALLLQDMGYDPYEAEYILAIEIPQDEVVSEFKIRELTKADVLSGLKALVITRDEARIKLLQLRYAAADVEFLLKIFDAQVKPPTEEKQRQASKADIVKAVKMGLITPEDGYLMLLDINFSPEASEFILMVQAESSPFSPISYNEFKDLADKWRRIAGLEVKAMPDELKTAADEVVRLSNEVEALNRSIAEERRGLVEEEVLPEETTRRLTELEVKRNRAIAELQRLKSEYDRLVAEWRHGLH